MINREEAIRHFESYVDNECYTDLCQDACRMAISAIRSQDGAARLAAYEKHGLEPCDYAAMKAAMENEAEARWQLSEVLGYIGGLGLDYLRELVKTEKEGRLATLPPNDRPLTLEELREKNGEPVWVCSPDNPNDGRYGIVWVSQKWEMENWFVSTVSEPVYFAAYGKVWVAYHRRLNAGKGK